MAVKPYRVICRDKQGLPFEVVSCGMETCGAVQEMYDTFEPKGRAQGLPPISDYTRRTWVEAVMGVSWNFVLQDQGQVVGHAAAIPDLRKRDAEYLIFLLPPYQNRGLGAALTRVVLGYLAARGIEKVFLEVEYQNTRAIHLYRKFSFEFCGQRDDPECVMACELDHAA